MAYSLILDTKIPKHESGFTPFSASVSLDQPLRIEVENHINQLYDDAGFPTCLNKRSTQAKLFELLKRHKKSASKKAIPP